MLVSPDQVCHHPALRVGVGDFTGSHGGQPLSGLGDPHAASRRLQPHHPIGPAGQPQPPAGPHHTVEQQVHRGVQALRVKRPPGIELHEPDGAVTVERRLPGQQRRVRVIAAAASCIGLEMGQRQFHPVAADGDPGSRCEPARHGQCQWVGMCQHDQVGELHLSHHHLCDCAPVVEFVVPDGLAEPVGGVHAGDHRGDLDVASCCRVADRPADGFGLQPFGQLDDDAVHVGPSMQGTQDGQQVVADGARHAPVREFEDRTGAGRDALLEIRHGTVHHVSVESVLDEHGARFAQQDLGHRIRVALACQHDHWSAHPPSLIGNDFQQSVVHATVRSAACRKSFSLGGVPCPHSVR